MRCSKCQSYHCQKSPGHQECLNCGHVDKRMLLSFPACTIHDVDQRSEEWFDLRRPRLTGSKFGAWLSEAPKIRLTISDCKTILMAEGIEIPKGAKVDELRALLPDQEIHMSESDLTKSSRKTAVYKVIGDLSKCPQPPDFEVDATGPPPKSSKSFSIWRGVVLEPFARKAFEELTGMKVEEVGFCSWNEGSISVSPDGRIVGTNTGWETKSPDPHVHAKYLDEGTLPTEYEPQVHGSMAATGADSWWFMSYCPRWRWREDLKQVEILPGGPPPLIIEVKRSELTERYVAGFHAFQKELERMDRKMADLYSKPAFEKVETRRESLV